MAFVVAAVFANAYPFAAQGYTEVLTALHVPIAPLSLVSSRRRRPVAAAGVMDFVKFTGRL